MCCVCKFSLHAPLVLVGGGGGGGGGVQRTMGTEVRVQGGQWVQESMQVLMFHYSTSWGTRVNGFRGQCCDDIITLEI